MESDVADAKNAAKGKKDKKGKKKLSAATADRHVLYQLSVQNVEAEIDFVDATYKELRGKHAVKLREDFCGTGHTSAEWVGRRDTNVATGLDIDQPTLDWGIANNIGNLPQEAQDRIRLLNRDVLQPGDARDMDAILAMNFSYWLFRTRDEMRGYFQTVRESLAPDGIFFLDHYGGYESMKEMREKRDIDGKFTYVWDQHSYDPISGMMDCFIHFEFKDKTRMKKAFTYTWRLWTLPEIQELLIEAGFSKATVYWEGEDEDGEGDGEFTATEVGEADAAFVCYIVAEQ